MDEEKVKEKMKKINPVNSLLEEYCCFPAKFNDLNIMRGK